ncbi:Phosphatidylinositol 4-phosphate 5-kinase its3 [Vanrija pseudolonga]|uniref:1-phosphatidylinositol-4-phosphate 5-kinase n=1 Tax=Vanrija pseudolonga TaxID=143232 RepID=A0AAF0YHN3_9TREE|nr:Phosphatidylinositol 4-phosphate 5-kinase its3 [Vanrija pseudolonga]
MAAVPIAVPGVNGDRPSFGSGTASPPRVNPYHYVAYPNNSDDLLPPLPPHLERLANGEGGTDDEQDSDTSDEEDDEDDVQFVGERAASPPTTPLPPTSAKSENGPPSAYRPDQSPNGASKRIMKKVSSVFRRGDQVGVEAASPEANTPKGVAAAAAAGGVPRGVSPGALRMQGPPPSPPLSDADDDEVASIAVTEATMDVPGFVAHGEEHNLAMETSESRAPLQLFSHPRSATPEQYTEPPTGTHAATPTFANGKSVAPLDNGQAPSEFEKPSAPFLGVQVPRRVSNGSTSSHRAGSLSMVRSGRLAPQRNERGNVSPERQPVHKMRPGVQPGVSSGPPSEASFSTAVIYQDEGVMTTQQVPRRHASNLSLSNLPPPRIDTSFNSYSASSSPNSINGQHGHLSHPGIQRRNTNPTTPSPGLPMGGANLQHSISASAHAPAAPMDDFNLPGDSLAQNILAQTEIVRRERLERRRQKQRSLLLETEQAAQLAETEAELARAGSHHRHHHHHRKETDETKVLVGNLVGEGHRNYVLMYNMLTGIRVAVSRCQAKIRRPLVEDDYLASHKYSFDMLGNELTPSAKYDFKFKDYAPWVFRELRDDHFHLDPADYLLSLTAKYILSELGSPGKSGSFFYYSRDYRFIIKTIPHHEHAFLRSILKDYHEHVRTNPHTLLSRFYGLHRVKMPRGRKIHFVIMNNLFPPHKDIHETYDLKGSAWGRETSAEKLAANPKTVLKDKNWVNRGRTLELGPEKRALFTEQLRRDMEFLRRINVMDYSLLVGIHNVERGNRDNLRENTLAFFQPEAPVKRKPSSVKHHAEANTMRRAVARADPKRLLDASQLPSDGSEDRRHFLFYQDDGGLRATDEQNRPMDIIYYLGVIDICTPYNTKKCIEHAWKSMTENPVTISCVEPNTYGQRFLNFLMSVERNGDMSLRPQGLEPPQGEKNQVTAVGCDHDPPGVEKLIPRVYTSEHMTDQEKAAAAVAEAIAPVHRAIVGHLKAE